MCVCAPVEQLLAERSSNLHQRTGGDHQGGCAQLGWRTFMKTCLRWILGYTRLEIWRKIGLSRDWCLCTTLRSRTGACYYWTVMCITHPTVISRQTKKLSAERKPAVDHPPALSMGSCCSTDFCTQKHSCFTHSDVVGSSTKRASGLQKHTE